MKRYLDYLYEIGFADNDHHKLAEYLFSIPYEWSLDMDENPRRCVSGIGTMIFQLYWTVAHVIC